MVLLSVNVSLPKKIRHGWKTVITGIFKEPAGGRVRLGRLNLAGDGQGDLRVHGGADKAVYAYPFEHYEHWKRELGRGDFQFGQFGENFTVEGLLEDQVHIGDVFRVGSARVQVTQPRIPCFKLALKMGLPQFPRLFMDSHRTGFYLRVLEEGEAGAGDPIERIEVDPRRMTVKEVFHLATFDKANKESLRRALEIGPLAEGWREKFAERLAKL